MSVIQITLAEQILDAGNSLVGLPSGFDLERDFRANRIGYKAVMAHLEGLEDAFHKFLKIKVSNPIKLPLTAPLSELDFYSVLGLSLIEHDMLGVKDNLTIVMAITLLNEKHKEFQKICESFSSPDVYHCYENVRIIAKLIQYIASGKPEFLTPVNGSSVPALMESLHGFSNVTYSLDDMTLQSDAYFGMSQLVKNAVRHMGASGIEGNIVVKLTGNQDNPVISVKDVGPGIMPDQLPFIFDGYTRGGTGIGLQVVKRMVKLRNGQVEVVTSPGPVSYRYDMGGAVTKAGENQPRGTAFTMYLPTIKQKS